MIIPNPGKYTQQWRHLCFPLREGIFNLFWHPRPCCNSPWCLFYLFKTWNRKIHPEIIVCKHTVYAFFVKKTKIFCVQARAAALSPAGAVFEATLTAGQLSCMSRRWWWLNIMFLQVHKGGLTLKYPSLKWTSCWALGENNSFLVF